jgi:GNAT superfamily N-acetyltransferase
MPTKDPIAETIYYLRPAESADQGLLLRLYAEGRTAELMLAGLDATQREVFVEMQFRARQMSYAENYATASDQIICAKDGTPAGRVLMDHTASGMRLVDIAVLNTLQRRGLGTQVICALQQECRTHKWDLKLQVVKGSAAERLYRRLGFEVEGEDSLRWKMIWNRSRN